MKKYLWLLIALALCVALSACGETTEAEDTASREIETTEEVAGDAGDFLGMWEYFDHPSGITIEEDGTYTLWSSEGCDYEAQWELMEDCLLLYSTNGGEETTLSFDADGNLLDEAGDMLFATDSFTFLSDEYLEEYYGDNWDDGDYGDGNDGSDPGDYGDDGEDIYYEEPESFEQYTSFFDRWYERGRTTGYELMLDGDGSWCFYDQAGDVAAEGTLEVGDDAVFLFDYDGEQVAILTEDTSDVDYLNLEVTQDGFLDLGDTYFVRASAVE